MHPSDVLLPLPSWRLVVSLVSIPSRPTLHLQEPFASWHGSQFAAGV